MEDNSYILYPLGNGILLLSRFYKFLGGRRYIIRLDVYSGDLFPGDGFFLEHEYKMDIKCEYTDLFL